VGWKPAGGSSDITEAVRSEGLPSVLRLDSMQAGKYQPRTRMDEGALQELAAASGAGVMQPILVRSIGGDRYEIIAGERRFRQRNWLALMKCRCW